MAKRGARGDGHIQEIRSGGKIRYRLVVKRDGLPLTGPLVDRRGEARRAWRDKFEAPQKPKSTTLKDSYEDLQASPWWKGLARSTRDQRRRHLGRFVAIYGRRSVSSCGAELVGAWRDGLDGMPRTKNTAANAVMIGLRRMGGNPGTLKALHEEDAEGRWLTPAEQRGILALDLNPRTRAIVRLGLRLGLRRGEIAGAKHEDFEDGGIHVRRAIGARIREPDEERGKIDVKKPKNANSTVWIPLPPDLRGEIGPPQSGLIVPANASRRRDAPPSPLKPMDPRNVARQIERAFRGTPYEGIGLHDFRRTFGMSLLEAGVDLRTAAEMMRHDPAMLAKIYARSRRDLKKTGAERLFEALGTNGGTKDTAA